MNTYAYARVSSYDQNLARQLQRLQDFGINAKHGLVKNRRKNFQF